MKTSSTRRPGFRSGPALCSFLFSLGIFISASAAQAVPSPRVIIGGKPVAFIVAPFIGTGGQLYAPVNAVSLLGASFKPDGSSGAATLTVTGSAGLSVTVPYTLVHGRYCVPLQRVALALGAEAEWQPAIQALRIRAKLQSVRRSDEGLAIYTSYPVYYTVRRLDSPERLSVDLYGLTLDTSQASAPTASKENPRTRGDQYSLSQIDPDTVRVTLDLKRSVPFRVTSETQSREIRVAPGGEQRAVRSAGLPPMPVTPPAGVSPQALVNPQPVTLPVSRPSGVQITSVSLKAVTDAATQIVIETSRQAKYRTERLENPPRLAFDIADATLSPTVRSVLPGSGPLLKAVRAGIMHAARSQYGRVVLDLASKVGFTVISQAGTGGGTTYLINLQAPPVNLQVPPDVATGGGAATLAGITVVVDPGHGAQDSGAVGIGGACEKDLTLAIGLRLRDALVQGGAAVYMTRDGDTFLPVAARPKLAVARHADYFISIHCDSSGGVNSHSGSTVYYHAQRPLCQLLAADVSRRVAEVSGISGNGTRSDTIRFSTGFGVLRGSPMPAILVECGYVNSTEDLPKLRNDQTQKRIAEGIIAGLRDFITDRAASTAHQDRR